MTHSIMSLLSALAGFGAAGFWFRSAAQDLPLPVAYWDKTPSSDAFLQALQASARDNRIAALLTGVSVLFMVLATLAELRKRQPHPPSP